ncbi:MAG: aspartate kinase [Actinobacteria bacterium]|nr:aspartate kinase [Actinomycetota bacterium]
MPVVVQKYGGSSVADPDRLEAVADRVRDTRASGNEVVVVVSAMGETTDQLVELAAQVSSQPHPREMDMLLTAGERITMALLAMALNERGVPAVSYTGSQAGILTDSAHGGARITRITGERVTASLGEGKVVIVAGFQGVDPQRREVTTLGRGGSDTTAVALAATLGASSCEVLTDVDGVFTADPRVVPAARKLEAIGYADMLELARAGAGVLMPHSVEYARDHEVLVHVRSSFHHEPGTMVGGDSEDAQLAGLAHANLGDVGVITLVGADADENAERAMRILGESGIESSEGGSAARMARIEVEASSLDVAVRLVHDRLLGMEASL